ncbi:MAG: hypothetical protein ACFE8L_03415 [Candidatus Hodarchaeota archaeon]
MDIDIFGVPLQEIVDWFLTQPLYGQILVLIGVVAILVLAVVIAYYVIKGVAYLVYYLLKGIYYLLKGIGLLFYKLCEAIYYAISGKEKPNANKPEQQEAEVIQQPVQQVSQPQSQKVIQIVDHEAAFCTECGKEFSAGMAQQLQDKGFVYCVHCGKGFKSNYMHIEAQ